LLASLALLPSIALLRAQTEKSYGQPQTPLIVAYVVSSLQHGDLASARALVAQYRRVNGDTPEALEALSWLARGEAAAGNLEQADQDAEEINRLAQTSLATRKLDAEPHLPLALGAAYEVEAEILARQNKRAEALQLLRSALTTWRGTSLVNRLQKNINLLTLEGKPMPALRATDWLGAKPTNPNFWRGKPLLLFFWAHWCADCKGEEPIISRLAAEFEPKGLTVLAPTRLYGYTAQDEHASPQEERAFIERVFQKYYASIPNAKVPFDAGNFERFGASTTPTIVLVDRRGIVRLYHPGAMDESALRAALQQLTR
jgi:thiol-disulfide isomerase/thioredoxin